MQLPPWSSHAIGCADNFRNHGGNSEVFMTGGAKQVCMPSCKVRHTISTKTFPKKSPPHLVSARGWELAGRVRLHGQRVTKFV